MDRFYYRVGVAGMIVLPTGIVINLYRDFHHPESWGDWQHNPYVYLPLVLLMVLCALPYILYVLYGIRRMHEEIKQRAVYLDYVRKLNEK